MPRLLGFKVIVLLELIFSPPFRCGLRRKKTTQLIEFTGNKGRQESSLYWGKGRGRTFRLHCQIDPWAQKTLASELDSV